MPARSLPWFFVVAAALFPWADAKTTAASNPPQPRTDLNGDPLPPGAVARLGAARLCQQAQTFLAFSPDDKTIAALDNGCLRLWDVRTGRELRHFDNQSVRALPAPNVPLAFSADGKLVALICGLNTVRIWETATGREVDKIENLPAPPSDLAFDPKGRLLAVGGNGAPIHLWDFKHWTRLLSGDTDYLLNVPLDDILGRWDEVDRRRRPNGRNGGGNKDPPSQRRRRQNGPRFGVPCGRATPRHPIAGRGLVRRAHEGRVGASPRDHV